MKTPLQRWIKRSQEADSLRSKSVLMTVFGDAITAHGGGAWLGSLIRLLAPFGINERLVRTSAFRLAEDGWLHGRRDGRRSHYTLTESGRRRFDPAYRRIYHRARTVWDGRWTIVMGTEHLAAPQRVSLRKELLWEGFSAIAPGVFMRPSGKEHILKDLLRRVELLGHVFVCNAHPSELLDAPPLHAMVERAWDLPPVMADYQRFIDRFAALPKLLQGTGVEAEEAFVVRILTIHAFRRVQLHDPHLPHELLSSEWPGEAAHALCRDIYQRTYAAAERYIAETLRQEDGVVANADAAFYQRFGGLARHSARPG